MDGRCRDDYYVNSNVLGPQKRHAFNDEDVHKAVNKHNGPATSLCGMVDTYGPFRPVSEPDRHEFEDDDGSGCNRCGRILASRENENENENENKETQTND
jgi:hypothetical protein